MIKIEDLEKIISIVEKHDISRFEFEQDMSRVVIEKGTSNILDCSFKGGLIKPSVDKKKDKEDEIKYIKSSLAGTFYLKKDEVSEPFVKIGDEVKEDTIIGLIEVMKLFNEISAGEVGCISKILVKDGDFVEYGQPLFELK